MLSGKSSLRNYYIFYTYHSIFSAIFIFVYFIHFFFFLLFIQHIDIYMFPMINFLKNLQFFMDKFKRFGVSILSLGLVLALNPVTTFAAEPETSVVTSESNAVGGWSEEDGYFVNPQAYSKAMEDGTTYASPKHTGKAEERTHNGTSQKRAHGWTTWVGKYHYTRARMEDWGAILTDSGRQWGTDGTEAISPWWSFNGDTLGSARTYYGS